MRHGRLTTAAVTAIVLGVLGAPARADAAPLCRPSMEGPTEYQATLGPLVSGFVLAPPAPGSTPPPPASTGIGAATLAREALGAQYSGVWLSSAVQGWAVGLAPGPLDGPAARGAIVDAIAARYTAEETAYLAERLHVDPQPYSDHELRATLEALSSVLRADGAAPAAMSVACRLSDARRVEVEVYSPATQPPVQALSVRVGGRSRTIAGRRLGKPLTVDLRGRRTRVAVTVLLADGRAGTQAVTYIRCR